MTNGEFLRFVKAGGYSNPKYWSAEGWGWRTFRNVKWPTFWMPDGPQGLHRCERRASPPCTGPQLPCPTHHT